jgi:response regulator RpfG family c-di-GMP phosphodiesterase
MDVQMPELSGLEVTALVRERERGRGGHVPIIAMTAHALTGDRERCLAAGCDSYVSKPVQAEELFQAIAVLAPPPAADLLCLETALRSVEGDAGLLAELTQLLRSDCDRLRADLRRALDEKNALQLRRAAHTLKGASSNFGASPLMEAARALERLGEVGDLTGAGPLVAQVELILDQLPAALDQLLLDLAAQPAARGQERAP